MFTAERYVRPATLQEALELNRKRSSTILGGGCWLRLGRKRIGTLIDLSGLGLDQIEERDGWVRIGAMVSLRQLETSALLKERFGSLFADMTGHIVGVQFRECATFGGSVWGRFGFSDILTGLLALDCEVELAEAGRIPLRDFAARKADRDILAAVWVQLDGRKAVYHTVRNAGTDFPVLACAVSHGEGETAYRLSIGARPMKAVSLEVTPDTLETALDAVSFGTNLRAGAAYRRHLASVLANRGIRELEENRHEYYCDTEWYGAHCRGASRYDLV